MSWRRGDVALAFYPFASGAGGGRRPVLIVQGDGYNRRIGNTIVAQITSNLTRADDPAHLLIDLETPEGRQSGLLHTSVVSCLNLATLTGDRIEKVIGRLSKAQIAQAEDCLRAALGLR